MKTLINDYRIYKAVRAAIEKEEKNERSIRNLPATIRRQWEWNGPTYIKIAICMAIEGILVTTLIICW